MMESIHYDILADETLDWLKSASSSDLLNYSKQLSQKKDFSLDDFSSALLSTLRVRRNVFMKHEMATNAFQILPEPSLLRLITGLTAYNAGSVFTRFAQEFSKLTYSLTQTNYSEWALETLTLWKNAFLFITAQNYTDESVVLKSILSTRPDKENIKRILEKTISAHHQLSVLFAANNFQKTQLPQGLKIEIKSLLEEFGFFPNEIISKATENKADDRLFSIISTCRSACRYIYSMYDAGFENYSEEEVCFSYWRNIATNKESEKINEYEYLKNTPEPNSAPIKYLVEIGSVIELENIVDGTAETALRVLKEKAGLKGILDFKEAFTGYFISSKEIAAIIDPIEPIYFIDKLRATNTPQARSELIESLRPLILPNLWPIAYAIFTLVAKVMP